MCGAKEANGRVVKEYRFGFNVIIRMTTSWMDLKREVEGRLKQSSISFSSQERLQVGTFSRNKNNVEETG